MAASVDLAVACPIFYVCGAGGVTAAVLGFVARTWWRRQPTPIPAAQVTIVVAASIISRALFSWAQPRHIWCVSRQLVLGAVGAIVFALALEVAADWLRRGAPRNSLRRSWLIAFLPNFFLGLISIALAQLANMTSWADDIVAGCFAVFMAPLVLAALRWSWEHC